MGERSRKGDKTTRQRVDETEWERMNELSITVTLDGEKDATYRFSESPVLVGRSPECHLNICHEAVPRELLSAWVEDDGKTVRLEERPGLTNRILVGKSIVDGGISGTRLDASVGPVSLRLEPAGVASPKSDAGGATRIRFFALIAVAVVAIAGFVLFNKGIAAPGVVHKEALPETPFCEGRPVHCASKDACLEMARLHRTRAEELLRRPSLSPNQQVRAATLLEDAASLYRGSDDAKAEEILLMANPIKERVIDTYQKERLTFLRLLEKKPVDRNKVERSARIIASYLGDCQGPWTAWLEATAGGGLGRRRKNG